jgi:hypothetical protein
VLAPHPPEEKEKETWDEEDRDSFGRSATKNEQAAQMHARTSIIGVVLLFCMLGAASGMCGCWGGRKDTPLSTDQRLDEPLMKSDAVVELSPRRMERDTSVDMSFRSEDSFYSAQGDNALDFSGSEASINSYASADEGGHSTDIIHVDSRIGYKSTRYSDL